VLTEFTGLSLSTSVAQREANPLLPTVSTFNLPISGLTPHQFIFHDLLMKTIALIATVAVIGIVPATAGAFFVIWPLFRFLFRILAPAVRHPILTAALVMPVAAVIIPFALWGREMLAVVKLDLNHPIKQPGQWMAYNDIPDLVIEGLEAAEDKHFAERDSPFDVPRMIKAGFIDLVWHKKMGGSGIMLQTAHLGWPLPLKNPLEKTIRRKVLEAILAERIAASVSKQRIVEVYLNEATFGPGIKGFRQAAYYWYGRELTELSPAEIYALLYTLRRPAAFNTPEQMRKAAARFLEIAAKNKLVPFTDIDDALAEMHFRAPGAPMPDALHAAPQDRWPLGLKLDSLRSLPADIRQRVDTEDLQVNATYNPVLTWRLQGLLSQGLHTLELAHPGFELEGSVVVIEVPSGKVKAIASKNPEKAYSYATQARRMAASTEKLFVLMAALQTGEVTLQTKLPDRPLWNDWPQNFGGAHYGVVTTEFALAHSLNTVFAGLAQRESVAADLARIHTVADLPPITPGDPSQALGTFGVTNLQLAAAVAAISNGGVFAPPTLVESVTARDGTIIYCPAPAPRLLCDKFVADDVYRASQQALQSGTGRHLPQSLKGGGVKTGTSSDGHGRPVDLRCVYLAGHFVVSLWVGCDRQSLWEEATSGKTLAPLAGPIFLAVEQGLRPDGSAFTAASGTKRGFSVSHN
jgi:penicillin-binding protein 1A